MKLFIKRKLSSNRCFFESHHSTMSWNLTSKKSSSETEYGVWKPWLVSPSNLKKIRFRSPCEKNHKTLLSKVKSLNGQIFIPTLHNKTFFGPILRQKNLPDFSNSSLKNFGPKLAEFFFCYAKRVWGTNFIL